MADFFYFCSKGSLLDVKAVLMSGFQDEEVYWDRIAIYYIGCYRL